MIDIEYMVKHIDELPTNVGEAWIQASLELIEKHAKSMLLDSVPSSLVAEMEYAEWYADDDGDGQIRSVGLMSIFDVPSGKYYMPWSSNVNLLEATIDEFWYEKLEDIISEAGYCMNIENDTIFMADYRTVDDASEEA